MNLTPDQLARCQAEFEAEFIGADFHLGKYDNGNYRSVCTSFAFQGFQAAWRPQLTKTEIRALVFSMPDNLTKEQMMTQIFRAMGG